MAFSQTAPPGSGSNVRIGVLGLFHPRELRLSAPTNQALVVSGGDEHLVLERSSGISTASIRLSGSEIVLKAGRRALIAAAIVVTGRKNEPVSFSLTVPGKIVRHYTGTLEIQRSAERLSAVVTMDRETAVASIVAAENTADTPIEALKAQAVATRSYLVASGRRHHDFDFCDTTHCQFLREVPAPGTAIAQAVETTRDLILTYESEPIAAMYTRSCTGRTHTPAEVGLPNARYPYYAVECAYCREHPSRWSSRIPASAGAILRRSNEPVRLRVARLFGWSALPSSDFTSKKAGGQILVEGTGQGHGIGLCQSGARAMAANGTDFHQILTHYYPNTMLVKLHSNR